MSRGSRSQMYPVIKRLKVIHEVRIVSYGLPQFHVSHESYHAHAQYSTNSEAVCKTL